MGLKSLHYDLENILSKHGLHHPDKDFIDRAINYIKHRRTKIDSRLKKVRVFFREKLGIKWRYVLLSLALMVLFDYIGVKVERPASIVSLAAVMIAGMVSLIVLRTNYNIEMLKFEEKWIFSLREDFSEYFYYYERVASDLFQGVSSKIFYSPLEGYKVGRESLEEIGVDFSPVVDEATASEDSRKMERYYLRIISKIDDGGKSHYGLVLMVKMLNSIIQNYGRIMTLEDASIKDKQFSHEKFRGLFTKNIRGGKKYVAKTLREMWGSEKTRKLKRNENIRSLYFIVVGVLLGLGVALSDVYIIGFVFGLLSFAFEFLVVQWGFLVYG